MSNSNQKTNTDEIYDLEQNKIEIKPKLRELKEEAKTFLAINFDWWLGGMGDDDDE
ncbi:hypothetical protein [Proteus mirabilis]|uniref:hypothetical protein n=1 Tax=Proteus mirabilis TaxID=584 RepID=UPI0034D7A9FC